MVVDLAVAVGLHLIARSWRKLAGKSEQELHQIEIERHKGKFTMHLPCWPLGISLRMTKL